jgi:hypothetical protein
MFKTLGIHGQLAQHIPKPAHPETPEARAKKGLGARVPTIKADFHTKGMKTCL